MTIANNIFLFISWTNYANQSGWASWKLLYFQSLLEEQLSRWQEMGTNYSRSVMYSKMQTVQRVPTIQEVPYIQGIPTMQRVPTIQRWSLATAKLCKLFTQKGPLKRTNLHIFISTNQVELMSDLQKSDTLHWLFDKLPKWLYNWFNLKCRIVPGWNISDSIKTQVARSLKHVQ